jgi:hypothetical protein
VHRWQFHPPHYTDDPPSDLFLSLYKQETCHLNQEFSHLIYLHATDARSSPSRTTHWHGLCCKLYRKILPEGDSVYLAKCMRRPI